MGPAPEPLTPLALAYRPLMSRRSLRPQLNQIRGWVRQGRTDAWIAHQLDVTVQQIQSFKREQDLDIEDGDGGGAAYDDEVDLRAEDDAAIAAELEEEAARKAAEEEAALKAAEEEAAAAARAEAEAREAEEAARKAAAEEDEDEAKPKRARRSRGGRTRRRTAAARPLEGTFDHGQGGYGVGLGPPLP